MDDALPEVRDDLKRRAGFAFATVIAMTFLAPWGSGHLPLPQRAFEWLVCIAIWEAAIWGARDILARWYGVGRGREQVPFRTYILTLGVASLPAVPLSMLVVNGTIGTLGDFVLFYADALGLGLILAAIRYGMRGWKPVVRKGVSADLAPLPTAGTPSRDFLQRHAPDLAGSRLLALSAEDHYLRIYTDRGQALALLRLRDAIDSLGEEAGLQVHRSFWVAMHAAPQAARRGQSWQLELPSGLSIPVSKARVAACRAVGWL
ncbi:MAG: LytTR family DNA-binding domain-containing protein [Gluconacetobacter liquefaciens]